MELTIRQHCFTANKADKCIQDYVVAIGISRRGIYAEVAIDRSCGGGNSADLAILQQQKCRRLSKYQSHTTAEFLLL